MLLQGPPNKSISKATRGGLAHDLLIIRSQMVTVSPVAMIHDIICNKGNKTLSMRMYSAKLTRHKPKIK